MAAPTLHALLVGIDQYKAEILSDLTGCVNDVQLVRDVLLERFSLPDENVRVLRNTEATREGIIDAFRAHLIDTARRWQAGNGGGAAPAFLFHFSGHGSRCRDRTTDPVSYDESLVAHDSRTDDTFDLRDWELGALVDELAGYTENVTIILDCCCSGSGTRAVGSSGRVRMADPDERTQPVYRGDSGARTRSTGDRIGSAGETGRHVLLAACRAHEAAQEHAVKVGDETIKHGAFSWYLAQELSRLPAGRELTYREFAERVRAQVNSRYGSQTPQCEGDRDRLLFGELRTQRDDLFTVTRVGEHAVRVNAGTVHGVSVGSELSFFPPETRVVPDSADGGLIAGKVLAVNSWCRAAPGSPLPPLHARVSLERTNYGNNRRAVALQIGSSDVRHAVETLLSQPGAAQSLELATEGSVADFVVSQVREELRVQDPSGTLLVAPFATRDLAGLDDDLCGLARYFNALQLENRDPASVLNGSLSIELYRVDESALPDADGVRRPERPVKPIEQTSDGLPIVRIGEPIAIRVASHTEAPLYCEVLYFGFDYAISPLCKALDGAQRRLEPGHVEWLGRHPEAPIQFVADQSDPGAFVPKREYLKVVGTPHDAADLSVLSQSGLREPGAARATGGTALDQLLRQTMIGGDEVRLATTRGATACDWTSTTLQYVVMGPPEAD